MSEWPQGGGGGGGEVTSAELAAETTAREAADALRLLASNNLSDVASAGTARTNLGLGTAATHPASDFEGGAEAVAAEKTRAEAAESTLTTGAAAEKTAREAVATSVGTEKTAREAADATLTTGAAAEKTAREAVATSVSTEKSRAEGVESTLTTGAATEKTARESADSTEKGRAETAEALKAPLASPTFTGTPAAPTAAEATSTTQLATTAFAHTVAGAAQTAAEAASTTALALKAPLASPTLTGTPAAPTASAGTNTTQLATTAFVKAARKKLNTQHAWVIAGAVEAGTLPGPVFIPAAGEELLAVRVDFKIREGTNVKLKLQKAGSDLTGFTGVEVTKTAGHAAPTAVAVAEGEELTVVIESVAGSPKGLSVTLSVEHTV